MTSFRVLASIALVGLLLALTWFVDDRARRPIVDEDFTPLAPAGRSAFASTESCRACHPEIYAEWERSQHAFSPRDPVFTMFETTGMRVEPGNPECQRCHHPAPVFATALGQYPRPRPDERDTAMGVTCLTCHALGDRIAASATRDDVPCRPRREPALRSARLCGGCHQNQQVRLQRKHEYEEWLERSALTRDRSCVDCHMDVVERAIVPGGAPRRSHVHTFSTTRDPEFLQRAFAIDAQVLERRVVVTLRNLGTGHRLPTGYRIRQLHVDARIEAEDSGNILWKDTYSLHREPRYGGRNTQLGDGEVRIVRFDPLPDDVTHGVLRVSTELAYAPFQKPTKIHALERPFPHAPLPLPAEHVPGPALEADGGDANAANDSPAAARSLVVVLCAAFLLLWLLGTLRRGA